MASSSTTRHLINNPPTHHTIRVARIIIPCPPINSHNNIIVLFRVLVHKFLPLLMEIIIIITCPRMIYGVSPLLSTMSPLDPYKTCSHFRHPHCHQHPFHSISHLAINVDHSNCPSIDIQPQDNNIKWI